MKPIFRGTGVTESERYLAKLADATFLDLWSYPNTFIDKRASAGTQGKELCDLLVVCGNDVVIFSDKSISWPDGPDLAVRWARWYRRAVESSLNQIRGAERWIRQFPHRIFVDPDCKDLLPFPFPPIEQMRVHGVAIALGAQAACKEYFGDEHGELMIASHLKGQMHVNFGAMGHVPFAFGDVAQAGTFVHVFDEIALETVLTEVDTITDFVGYLTSREKVIREEHIMAAPSERDLLSWYLQNSDAVTGLHRFPTPADVGAPPNTTLVVPEGEWKGFVSTPGYRFRG